MRAGNQSCFRTLRRTVFILCAGLLSVPGIPSHADEARWWKGNLHTHTLWSDGDDYPESVAAWYKDHGYHFLALSDHNLMLTGERWISPTPGRGGGVALEKNRQRFGSQWLEQRVWNGTNQVRLKTLEEFRGRLEIPGQFLMIPSEEITGGYLTFPVHINATNLREPIAPAGGSNVLDVIQRVVKAVLDQRARTGQPMFAHINHPNYVWGITAEDLAPVPGERFFEVYNGHPSVNNAGDGLHAGMDQTWDIVLTWRLARLHLPPVYGLAVDDSHNYHGDGLGHSNPGRGWIMVRSARLDPESLITAMEAGEFYASTGVTLKEVRRSGDTLRVEIEPEQNVTYRTRFIGTRRGFHDASQPVTNSAGEPVRATRRYHGDVGETLAEVEGPVASYRLRGDELYVRARVTSSRPLPNGSVKGETAVAWTQPVLP